MTEWTNFLDSAALQGRLNAAARVVVVNNNGVPTEFWADKWHVSVQDDVRTLKLFAEGDGAAAEQERSESLARDLAR